MGDWSWSDLAPWGAAGFSGLGSLFSYLQQQERNKQLADLRAYYTDPNQITARSDAYFKSMMPAAESALSRITGDAASRGWAGNPGALASLIPQAYGPYQAEALNMALGQGSRVQPFLTPAPSGYSNPFESFARVLGALKGMDGSGNKGGWATGTADDFSTGAPANLEV